MKWQVPGSVHQLCAPMPRSPKNTPQFTTSTTFSTSPRHHQQPSLETRHPSRQLNRQPGSSGSWLNCPMPPPPPAQAYRGSPHLLPAQPRPIQPAVQPMWPLMPVQLLCGCHAADEGCNGLYAAADRGREWQWLPIMCLAANTSTNTRHCVNTKHGRSLRQQQQQHGPARLCASSAS